MYPSRAKSRGGWWSKARGTQRGGSPRRLRVEGMERRLMLSATTPEAVPLHGSFLSPMQSEITFFTGVSRDQLSAEGGPILLNADDAHGTSVPGIWSASPQAEDTNGFNAGQGVFDSDADNAWSDYYTTDGLPPAVLDSRFNWGTVDASVAKTATHFQESGASGNEGGSIAIGSVLADLKQQPVVAAETPAPTHELGATPELHRSERGTSAAMLIPGEWGRASVFEMVNGGRSADDHVALNSERAKSRGDNSRSDVALPLLLNGEGEAAPKSGAPQSSADKIRSADQSPEPHRIQAARQGGEGLSPDAAVSFSANPILSENHRYKDSFSAAGAVKKPDGATPGAEPQTARASVIALALDQLGNVENVVGSWGRSRVTAAMILVLALERVAAFNSREAGRQLSDEKKSPSARRKPIRRQLGAVLGLDAR